jgi:hypothetical protein
MTEKENHQVAYIQTMLEQNIFPSDVNGKAL